VAAAARKALPRFPLRPDTLFCYYLYSETLNRVNRRIVPAIGVHDDVFEKLRLLARAWDISEPEVVARLLVGIPIHAIYEGVRIGALFDPVTSSVTITSGPCAGQTFKSPSGAAVALVGALNPAVKPNRSGWSFWWISETGEMLQVLRRH
jgi:hypothetical protein